MVEILVVKACDKESKTVCSWAVPSISTSEFVEIGDEWWSATFGTIQSELLCIDNKCIVELDFSHVEWIDPLPLLSLIVAVNGFCVRSNSSLHVLLGSGFGHNSRRRGFLKFLGQHGFLQSLWDLPQSLVNIDNEDHHVSTDSVIWEKLVTDLHVLMYPESRCLNSKIIAVNNFRQNDRGVDELVKSWLDEIRDYGLKRFEHDAEYVDDMLHKLRILLTENVLNAAEHAWHGGHSLNSNFFGIYARVRREALPGEQSSLSSAIHSENLRCPALANFSRDCHCSWIEIFYYDDGRGLLADIDAWKLSGGERLRQKLSKVKPNTNALHYISRHIFQDAISRHERKEKTILTGLQHAGLVLAVEHDYVRIFSGGEWVGATLPWSRNVHGQAINLKKQEMYSRYEPSRGTAWHYCVRLNETQKSRVELSGARVDKFYVESATDKFKGKDLNDWKIFDERDLGSGIGYIQWNNEKLNSSHSFWLPGAVTKQHIYQWLAAINKNKVEGPFIWLIADLSREQARTTCAILKSEISRNQPFPKLFIYVVTNDWHICCFNTSKSRTGLNERPESYCIDVAKQIGGSIFKLLRKHDSNIFWSGIIDNCAPTSLVGPAYINERVIWDRDEFENPRVVLKGYLDLTQALVDTRRTFVAQRALRRIWHLFVGDKECVASDALLTNLLPREARQTPSHSSDNLAEFNTKIVIVNSVLVTGATSGRHGQVGRESIHLLRHSQYLSGEENIPDSVKKSNRYALNWLEEEVGVAETPEGKLPYERIPGTPYIGRGGTKAIPLRRFERKENGTEYFERSIYEQNPQETYDHFLRLGLLKSGHWVYGSHHDLFTINIGLAIDRESLDHGPILKWICAELAHQKSLGAELVIYPSHPVTEKLVQAIKKNITRCDRYIAQEIFVPVHFLGNHTQTSIRIPSLTYDRIRKFIQDKLDADPNYKCRVLLLDDGALTGKVQRELEQLIRNAGAKEVIHIALVTRTGLPLYRQYLVNEYRKFNRYYWRWDVPPLGSARTCPLCRALHQAREIAVTLWNIEAQKTVQEWAEAWAEKSVNTDWWRSGLSPAKLPEPRPMTFGKEWLKPDGAVEKYSITHATTTGLASSVIELIRTTSYKDVGLKKAKLPWGDEKCTPENEWRRARLEILNSQTLLFFDDFDQDELTARILLILEVLGSERDLTDVLAIDRLSCLILLLSTDNQTREVIQRIAPLLPTLNKGDIEFQISLGLLIRRSNFSNKQILNFAEQDNKLDPHTKISIESLISTARTLAQGSELLGTAHGLQMLIMLLGEAKITIHTGFLRKRIVGEIESRRTEIARDLGTLVQAFEELDPLICDAHTTIWKLNEFIEYTKVLEQILMANEQNLTEEISNTEKQSLVDGIEIIFGNFQKTFLNTVAGIASHLRTAVTYAEFSKKLQRHDATVKERWTSCDLPTVTSDIISSSAVNDYVVAFPPVAKQMLLDSLLDVVHSSQRYENGSDMNCLLSVNEEVLTIEMRNRAKHADTLATTKASEAIYSQHIFPNPIQRQFNVIAKEMIVSISLPLVTALGRRQL